MRVGERRLIKHTGERATEEQAKRGKGDRQRF